MSHPQTLADAHLTARLMHEMCYSTDEILRMLEKPSKFSLEFNVAVAITVEREREFSQVVDIADKETENGGTVVTFHYTENGKFIEEFRTYYL